MTSPPISTRPPSDNENLLRTKFYESIAGQSELLDRLGGQLLTLEPAVPGIYAAVVKLIGGDTAAVAADKFLFATLGCWSIALVLTLVALVPRSLKVDTTLLKQDPKKFDEGPGIEDFFTQSARYKRRLLVASSVLFFAGIVAAIFTRIP